MRRDKRMGDREKKTGDRVIEQYGKENCFYLGERSRITQLRT